MLRISLFYSMIFMLFGTVALCYRVGPIMPEKLLLLRECGLWMLAFWLALWWNLGTIRYVIVRHLRLAETGRKVQQLDPMRNPEGLFNEEVRGNDD